MPRAKIRTITIGAVALVTLMTGCAPAPQVTVQEACDAWFDAISDSDQLAGDMTVGETSADIKKRIEAWREMSTVADSIAPTLSTADPLVSGLFRTFAEAADKSTPIAERVANGAVEDLGKADAAREELLDAFYPIADVCIKFL